MEKKTFMGCAILLAIGMGWAAFQKIGQDKGEMMQNENSSGFKPRNTELASFGGGCFWCVEAVFQRKEGVVDVVSGYQGGDTRDPTYKEVCNGNTGHAEVVRVEFDPAKTAYQDLVELFFKAHDPTTLNRQGADVGTQYRSAIFTYSKNQEKIAKAVKEQFGKSGVFPDPIVTEITDAPEFYPAEDDHQNYYNKNKSAPYCAFNITPKLKKLEMK